MWWFLPESEDNDIALVRLINVGRKGGINDLCVEGFGID